MQETAAMSLPAATSGMTDLTVLESQASKSCQLANYDEAEHTYRRLIDLRADEEGIEATYRDRFNLSATLVKQRKFQDAETSIREVLAFLTSRTKEEAPEHFQAQEDAACRILEEAVAGQSESKGILS